MLLNIEDIFPMLRCPLSGSPLVRVENKLHSSDNSVKLIYDVIQGYPVLVNFVESVLSPEDIKILDSVIIRHSYRGWVKIAKLLVSPPQASTAKNVGRIFRLLSKDKKQPNVLLIGGGTVGQGMQRFYTDPFIKLVAFDIYGSPSVQFIADAHNIPLPDESFDLVIVQAVLEHVLDPRHVVSEIHRVLKQDGIVYAETPFLQHVHEGAYDFTRFTEIGHRYLFKNFALIDSGASAGAGTQLLWSLDNFFRGIFRSRNAGKFIKLCFFWLQYLDKFIPESYNIDSASGVFFLGRKSSIQVSKKSIISHYRGAQK